MQRPTKTDLKDQRKREEEVRHSNVETWMAQVRAWPMCRAPVTFGGGRTCRSHR